MGANAGLRVPKRRSVCVTRRACVRHRLLALLNGRSADEIAKSLRGMVDRHGLDARAAAPVIKCTNYLVKNGRWLHYDRALAGGLPIATDVIEGACRYLVQDRMGRTGARWSLPDAEAILRLRALRTSGDAQARQVIEIAPVEHRRDRAAPFPVSGHVNLSTGTLY